MRKEINPAPCPLTHIIKLCGDSTVFRVDVSLGEEWRHLGKKKKGTSMVRH